MTDIPPPPVNPSQPGPEQPTPPQGAVPYPQPGYGMPPAPPTGQPSTKKGFAITSLVLGIIALLGSWIPFLSILSIPIALVGLVFGIIAMVMAFQGKAGAKVLAIVGTSISALAIILAIVSTAIGTAAVGGAIDEIQASIDAEVADSIAGDDTAASDDEATETEDAAPAESALTIVDQQYWLDDYGYWNYYVLIDNGSDTAYYDFESFDMELVDADGVILDSSSDYPTILPATEVALVGSFYDSEGLDATQVAGMDVRLPESPSQTIDAGSAGTLSVDSVEPVADEWSVTIDGNVTSGFVDDQENVNVVVVAFDAEGTVVSGGHTYIDRLPAGGTARYEVSMYDIDSTDGLTFKAWATLF